MSRYADDSNNATAPTAPTASSNQGSLYDQPEAALPTYDEVVGGESSRAIGFKSDILLPLASSTDQGHSSGNGDAPNHENHADSRRPACCKPKRTGTILLIIGMILIPMCSIIIILQVKVCATDHSQLQETVDKLNASYSECLAEMENLQDNLDSNENHIRDLNYKVEKLISQRDYYKGLVYDKSSNAKASVFNSVDE